MRWFEVVPLVLSIAVVLLAGSEHSHADAAPSNLSSEDSCLGQYVVQPISLGDALNLVRHLNPRVIGAEQDLAKARATEYGSTAAFMPQVTGALMGEAFHTEQPGSIATIGSSVVGGVADTYSNYPTVGANWNLFNGGKDLATYRAARSGVRASQADLSNSLDDALVATLTAFNDLEKAQYAEQQKGQALQLRRAMVSRARERLAHGTGTTIALGKAQIELAQAEREHLKACRVMLDKSVSLSQTIGQAISSNQVLHTAGTLPTPPGLPGDEHVLDRVIEADPSVVAAHQRIEQAEHKLAQARAPMYPTLALMARYDWLGQNPDDFTHAWDSTARNSYRYGFVFQQNLFPFVAIESATASAQADLEKARAALEEARIATLTRLRQALHAVAESKATVVTAERSAREAREIETLSKVLYERGHADLDAVDQATLDVGAETESVAEATSDHWQNLWLAERALHPDGFADRLMGAARPSTTESTSKSPKN